MSNINWDDFDEEEFEENDIDRLKIERYYNKLLINSRYGFGMEYKPNNFYQYTYNNYISTAITESGQNNLNYYLNEIGKSNF